MPRLVTIIALWAVMQVRADPEIHLIPEGYTGEVTIVFNAPDGASFDVEDGARLYRIPVNGILFTQFPVNYGMDRSRKFFLVTPYGDRHEIHDPGESTLRDTPENRANPRVEIFSSTRNFIQAGIRSCEIQYEQYFVGTRAQLLDRSDANLWRINKYVQDTFKCP
jgi:hypothetical protein